MRSALATVANRRATRNRSSSNLTAIPPSPSTGDYVPELAAVAATIVYRSPLPSPEGHPIFVINAAALPDTFEVDYDSLLPYVLARLPGEDDLITGTEYEIIFFAGGQPDSAVSEKKQGPGIGWYLQAYHVLSRAMRKRLQRLYIVHPRTWVRVLISVFSTIVSPKFRRKIIHIGSLSALQRRMPIEDLLIPPSAFLHDRRLEVALEQKQRRAFGAAHPLPKSLDTGNTRLPKVLRETTSFLIMPSNLMTEGLFRIPPHSLLASVLHDAYDRGQKFIVWKEPGATFAQPDLNRVLLSEVKIDESYGVHLAAALIKTWYRELHDPVVPESAYSYIREHFQDYTRPVILDDLAALLDPKSSLSVLTSNSRSMLTRHLLPLLSVVASYEQYNKMTSQNLSICFAITLLRGTNQIEDVKISSILQRLLAAAIEQWPQLREKLDIQEYAFLDDLKAPASMSDYEDPLVTFNSILAAEQTSHRILMTEDESGPETINTSQGLMQPLPKLLNKLPVKLPASIAKSAPTIESTKPPPPAVPKRKPARSISKPSETEAQTVVTTNEPPRYSTIFGTADELQNNDSPQDDRQSCTTVAPPYEPVIITPSQSALIMPKRKAVMAGGKDGVDDGDHIELVRSLPDDAVRNISQSSNDSQEDAVFRKPSWPASARQPSNGIQSLAKPVLPIIQQSTPLLVTNSLALPGLPKPRTPSPGLLQRMNSFDTLGSTLDSERHYKLMPGKLSLKKASVDDLRRLYEERLETVNGLARSNMMKRSYSIE